MPYLPYKAFIKEFFQCKVTSLCQNMVLPFLPKYVATELPFQIFLNPSGLG